MTDIGDVMPVDEWILDCNGGCLIDDDGYGYLTINDQEVPKPFFPSQRHDIPPGATHIRWFNR